MERSVAGILVHRGRAFVARRGPSASFGGYWEFPGGKVEGGESDEAAIAREFDEEFGVAAVARRLLGELSFPHKGRDRTLAAWLIEAPAIDEAELKEHLEVAWAGADELEALDLVDSDRRLLAFVLPALEP
jgi:8-oxo-dGTP diphosphatase